jgi:peptide/nickel transport system substrate-binding protein
VKKVKRNILWILVGCLMVLSLVITSCGKGGEVEEKEKAEVEEPEYGGMIMIPLGGDIEAFDESVSFHPGAHTLKLTNEELLTGDWAKGPAGTNDSDWTIRGLFRWEQKTGAIAESWEMPEVGTIIFHIRKGIHWALNPDSEASQLVKGRELTADDVAWTLNHYLESPQAWLRNGTVTPPRLGDVSLTAPDKWTVVLKTTSDLFYNCGIDFSDFASIIPREVVEKYGDMTDWHNSVGTGPFMLTDVIPGNTVTLVRNPNYWGKDPVGPGKGNQLPYLDSVKYLIIPDASTQQAALRTGEVDLMAAFTTIDWETAAVLMKTAPKLLYKKYNQDTAPNCIHMRTDQVPFNDKLVRRALMMATDFESLKRDLFGGDAQILTWPKTEIREYKNAYLGLDDPEMPASVRELYTYSPEKAKQLLEEAGYPNGFKTTITCPAMNADYLSVIKDMWAKVNIDLTLDTLEPGAWVGIVMSRNFEQMIQGFVAPIGSLYNCIDFDGERFTNCSYVDDARVKEVYSQMQVSGMMDPPEADRMYKELMKYVLDQAWVIPTPLPPLYHMWWPWVKNYRGEGSVGYDNSYNFTKFVWIDQALKKTMGY